MKRKRKPRLLRQRRPYRAAWLGWDHMLKKAYGPATLRAAGAMMPLKTPFRALPKDVHMSGRVLRRLGFPT